MKNFLQFFFTLVLFLGFFASTIAQDNDVIIFENVRIFDGVSSELSRPSHVVVTGNTISQISRRSLRNQYPDAKRINGEGMTLMPGLIDTHVHLTFGSLSMEDMMNPNINMDDIANKVGQQTSAMLLRGFTSVRDAGGPIFEIKAAANAGMFSAPRIWPSGATISQTAGHGDFRMPHERSRRFFGEPSRAELLGATFIADGRDEVLTAVRENLRFGASQIKLMAGGGTSSAYDPVDVTQYTLDEMKAAVEAAEDWGTYVMVHAYTPRAIRRAIEAGVKVIEHGQLLDRETMELMKENDVWLSTQVLRASTPDMDPQRREKRKPVIEGQAKMWPMVKEVGVKVGWGTDFLFEPDLNKEQNAYILQLLEWFSPAETLKMVTHDNAQMLALSGLRSPHQGILGVVQEGAYADLLLVNGNPLENMDLIATPEESFVIIMKDGHIYKDITGQ